MSVVDVARMLDGHPPIIQLGKPSSPSTSAATATTDGNHNDTDVEGEHTSSSSSSSIQPIRGQQQQQQRVLECKDMEHLEIIRSMGVGKHKQVYEVKLPWGEHAVAKRCKTKRCVQQKRLEHEFAFLSELQHQYGNATLQVFGACQPPPPPPPQRCGRKCRAKQLEKYEYTPEFDVTDFLVGYTSVMELGQPLIKTWLTEETMTSRDINKYRKCIAQQFTSDDLEDFRVIAKQFAGHLPHPYLLRPYNDPDTDNIYAEQYILSNAGICMGDMDMVHECDKCSYEQALEINCEILRRVTFQEDLDCAATSLAVAADSLEKQPIHINMTEAHATCVETIRERVMDRKKAAERKAKQIAEDQAKTAEAEQKKQQLQQRLRRAERIAAEFK